MRSYYWHVGFHNNYLKKIISLSTHIFLHDPYFPRTLFVSTGLLDILNPTNDELAFLIIYEIVHATLGRKYNTNFLFQIIAHLILYLYALFIGILIMS
jgi:hypothetical protein